MIEKLFGKTFEQLRAEAEANAQAKQVELEKIAASNNDNNNKLQEKNALDDIDNLPSEKMYQKTRLDTL